MTIHNAADQLITAGSGLFAFLFFARPVAIMFGRKTAEGTAHITPIMIDYMCKTCTVIQERNFCVCWKTYRVAIA